MILLKSNYENIYRSRKTNKQVSEDEGTDRHLQGQCVINILSLIGPEMSQRTHTHTHTYVLLERTEDTFTSCLTPAGW